MKMKEFGPGGDARDARPVGVQILSFSSATANVFLGEANTNLTGLYDMLVRMSGELEAMRKRQLVTEKELNATREVLRIGTFTGRKRSCGKVMFLHLSVIMFTGGGGVHPRWEDFPLGRQPPGRRPQGDTHPPRDGHCSVRYASYWHAQYICTKAFSLSIHVRHINSKCSINSFVFFLFCIGFV